MKNREKFKRLHFILENNLFKYYVILIIINILIGAWNVILFEHHIGLNNYIFNFVIIELYLFLIKCLSLMIYTVYIILANLKK